MLRFIYYFKISHIAHNFIYNPLYTCENVLLPLWGKVGKGVHY